MEENLHVSETLINVAWIRYILCCKKRICDDCDAKKTRIMDNDQLQEKNFDVLDLSNFYQQ